MIGAGATIVGLWRKATWAPIAAVVTAAFVGLPVATLVFRFLEGPGFSGWLLAIQAAQICAFVVALRVLVRRAAA
jgi:uncharacterized membrane protein (DUF2068 family)